MTEVKFLGQTFEYVPQVSGYGYLKRERVSGHTLVDGERDREMYYNRYSFAENVSGPFETLYELPFGLTCVSGA